MATTSFLYHALGVKGYRHRRTEYVGGVIRYHIGLREDRRRCRGCGRGPAGLHRAGRFERVFAAVPVGHRRQEIVLHGHVQQCFHCGRSLREPIGFAKGKQRLVRALAAYVIRLCEVATIMDVAGLVGLGWDCVKEIFKGHLRCRLRKRSLRHVRWIAVDEFAIRKNARYLTVVLDLHTGEVLWVGNGRRADALEPFLRRLRRCRAPLQAVAVDMWPAYTLAVRTVFPKVTIVHDPFHIVHLVNRAIDNAQRELASHLPQSVRHRRGLRFVLLRAIEHLDDDGQQLLATLMTLNQPLYQCYLLKEQLRQLWSFASADLASSFLDQWIQQARSTGLRCFSALANTLHSHQLDILSWYRFPISTGPLEGLNNKIKVLKRQAYGFRDLEYFKLRLAFIGSSTPRFPG